MLEAHAVLVIAAKESRDAWRNRWYQLFTAAFVALALTLSWLSVVGVSASGFAAYGRTAASLVNLVILVVPLMGLLLGSHAIAGERERGSLLFLLAQPLTPGELVLGKFVGLSTAILSSLLLGFGGAALVLAARRTGGEPASYLAFLALAGLLALASVSLGLLASALSRRASVATGVCLFLWLLLVFLGDLGLMGTSVAMRFDARQILFGALVNPLQVFKIAALLAIRGGVEALGPAGLAAQRLFGSALWIWLSAVLLAWVVVPLGCTVAVMERGRGAA